MTSTRARQAARRLFRRCLVDGTLDEAKVRHVAARLATAGQRGTLTVLNDFGRLVRLEVDRRRALIESATPLTDAFADDLRQRLTEKYGAGLATSFVLNPSLIGGLRIKVGSDVIDGSVKARLAALEARL